MLNLHNNKFLLFYNKQTKGRKTMERKNSAYELRIRAALIGGQQLNFDELRKKTGIPVSNLLNAVTAMEMNKELIYNTNTLKYSIRN